MRLANAYNLKPARDPMCTVCAYWLWQRWGGAVVIVFVGIVGTAPLHKVVADGHLYSTRVAHSQRQAAGPGPGSWIVQVWGRLSYSARGARQRWGSDLVSPADLQEAQSALA